MGKRGWLPGETKGEEDTDGWHGTERMGARGQQTRGRGRWVRGRDGEREK